MRPARFAVSLLLAAAARPAGAQTMLDQEQRLIEVHSLLLALTPVGAPGGYGPGQVGLGLEWIAIPDIDGTTGGKRQITASDRTRVFPRPRLALGLPLTGELRAFAGVAYVPPFRIRDVSSHQGAIEGGIAYLPGGGPWALGLRGHLLYARSQSPVTDPSTRDTLRTFAGGADVTAGYSLQLGWMAATGYAGAGAVRVDGDFRVASDGVTLSRAATDLLLVAGLRAVVSRRFEGVAELVAFPGRLIHPNFRIAYLPDW